MLRQLHLFRFFIYHVQCLLTGVNMIKYEYYLPSLSCSAKLVLNFEAPNNVYCKNVALNFIF